jgi:hypothetical protein
MAGTLHRGDDGRLSHSVAVGIVLRASVIGGEGGAARRYKWRPAVHLHKASPWQYASSSLMHGSRGWAKGGIFREMVLKTLVVYLVGSTAR